MYIEAMKDCGAVLWKLKVLGELILYKIFFVAIKTVIYTQTLKHF
jgi:hypothetical protein